MRDTENFSTDELEVRLVAIEQTIAQLRAEQASLIEIVDRRQVPLADGCRSLAEWVSGRLDIARRTAGQLIATARRLPEQDALAKALSDGELSFDRATALIRLNGHPGEFAHVGLSALHQIAATESLTAGSERAAFERRHLTIQPTLDMTSWTLWGQLPGHDGQIVQDALAAKADAFPESARSDSRATRNADALTALCMDSLTETSTSDQPATDSGITVFVDARYGPNGYLAGGPAVGPYTLDELVCTGTVEVTGIGADGTPLNQGRRNRKIPPRLRRFVIGRDRGCAAQGCTSRYRLQAHHRKHWADGGETDAENLVALCWYHHHVVIHQRGFAIDPESPSGDIRFVRPHIRGP